MARRCRISQGSTRLRRPVKETTSTLSSVPMEQRACGRPTLRTRPPPPPPERTLQDIASERSEGRNVEEGTRYEDKQREWQEKGGNSKINKCPRCCLLPPWDGHRRHQRRGPRVPGPSSPPGPTKLWLKPRPDQKYDERSTRTLSGGMHPHRTAGTDSPPVPGGGLEEGPRPLLGTRESYGRFAMFVTAGWPACGIDSVRDEGLLKSSKVI